MGRIRRELEGPLVSGCGTVSEVHQSGIDFICTREKIWSRLQIQGPMTVENTARPGS